MQKKYNGCWTVLDYCRRSEEGTLVYPKEPGYKSHGYYKRYAVDENGVKHRIAIRRDRNKKQQKDAAPNISRLPKMLCPYRKHPVTMMSRIMTVWRRGQAGMDTVIDEICRIYDKKSVEVEHDLVYLTRAQVLGITKVFEEALRKYRMWQSLPTYGWETFVVQCAQNDHKHILAMDTAYNEANGGRFLFGTAVSLRRATVSTG
jgi:hypothetical protein